MAFTEKTVAEAWARSGGQCECERRFHAHFRTPCGKALVRQARGMAVKGGWEAHEINLGGGYGIQNCEILCWGCYESAMGYALPDLFSPFPVRTTQRPRIGDYLKLESGDEGRVNEIRYDSVCIKALDGNDIIVPNSEIRRIVVNYGQSSKRAKEPFHFQCLVLLRKVTGLKAKNLTELVNILRNVPDAVIYYHTHQFLQEHHYLVPEPPNDFAAWVVDSLGDEMLGERLASINPFSFHDLEGIREKLVAIIEEHIAQYPNQREAMEGNEFYFVKSAKFVFPTPYVTNDLREFVGALRRVSLGSLYLHMFESRLKSARGLNDFSIWLMDSLAEDELGRSVARTNPYAYSLEGLRSSLINLLEKHIE